MCLLIPERETRLQRNASPEKTGSATDFGLGCIEHHQNVCARGQEVTRQLEPGEDEETRGN